MSARKTGAPGPGEALARHIAAGGKMQTLPKCAIRGPEDFAVWYTPGVAEACRAIAANPAAAFDCTNKANLVAVVSDGTRVLGIGDIGPLAGLPVMEGKSLLFKFLGGVDAVAICLATKNADEIVQAVRWLEPSFGAVNLEDIAQPKCFRVLEAARAALRIPVWHDDQQGTAVVVLAGLENALGVTGRVLADARIVLVGTGAANVATYRLLTLRGADPRKIVACDSTGILHPGRTDIAGRREAYPEKWRLCTDTNGEGRTGGIADALAGADACLAFSTPGPGVIAPAWIATMARDPIVFACA
ncbi:MAG: NADP-dependent malic enzyme, partial [Rhodospirillaceae bacterium]|nr:NADP-dependent malic enzyme [Rhodospirillaceae bacterium]